MPTTKLETVMLPIPCMLFDLRLRQLIIKLVVKEASNKCHSNNHQRITELIH
jgi:hypothetical protein